MIFSKKDIIEKFIHSSGNGGQNVNKLATCVYLKHLPTGIEIKCQYYRTQAENRRLARKLLENKIIQFKTALEKQIFNEIEKEKRKSRPKPQAIKEFILQNKKRRSETKSLRKKINLWD